MRRSTSEVFDEQDRFSFFDKDEFSLLQNKTCIGHFISVSELKRRNEKEVEIKGVTKKDNFFLIRSESIDPEKYFSKSVIRIELQLMLIVPSSQSGLI